MWISQVSKIRYFILFMLFPQVGLANFNDLTGRNDQGKTAYQVLGVDPNTPTDDIKKAFRKATKRNHHDGGFEENQVVLNSAYDLLKDPEKRAEYDRLLKSPGSHSFQGTNSAQAPSMSIQVLESESDIYSKTGVSEELLLMYLQKKIAMPTGKLTVFSLKDIGRVPLEGPALELLDQWIKQAFSAKMVGRVDENGVAGGLPEWREIASRLTDPGIFSRIQIVVAEESFGDLDYFDFGVFSGNPNSTYMTTTEFDYGSVQHRIEASKAERDQFPASLRDQIFVFINPTAIDRVSQEYGFSIGPDAVVSSLTRAHDMIALERWISALQQNLKSGADMLADRFVRRIDGYWLLFHPFQKLFLGVRSSVMDLLLNEQRRSEKIENSDRYAEQKLKELIQTRQYYTQSVLGPYGLTADKMLEERYGLTPLGIDFVQISDRTSTEEQVEKFREVVFHGNFSTAKMEELSSAKKDCTDLFPNDQN